MNIRNYNIKNTFYINCLLIYYYKGDEYNLRKKVDINFYLFFI